MQVYGNLASLPERKESRTTGKGYYQFRICEAQRGVDNNPTWYTVRVMKDDDPLLEKGDFVKVTGKLKADFYVGRDGKPTGTLLIIAFEASKIAKPAVLRDEPAGKTPDARQAEPKARESVPERATDRAEQQGTQRPQEPVRKTVHLEEADWSTMYD